MVAAKNMLEMVYAFSDASNVFPSCLTFTPRGKEVFACILKGCSDKEIGQELGISYGTVRWHKEHILKSNNCPSIRELVSKYYAQDQLQNLQSSLDLEDN